MLLLKPFVRHSHLNCGTHHLKSCEDDRGSTEYPVIVILPRYGELHIMMSKHVISCTNRHPTKSNHQNVSQLILNNYQASLLNIVYFGLLKRAFDNAHRKLCQPYLEATWHTFVLRVGGSSGWNRCILSGYKNFTHYIIGADYQPIANQFKADDSTNFARKPLGNESTNQPLKPPIATPGHWGTHSWSRMGSAPNHCS